MGNPTECEFTTVEKNPNLCEGQNVWCEGLHAVVETLAVWDGRFFSSIYSCRRYAAWASKYIFNASLGVTTIESARALMRSGEIK